jgi:hypothetical protein
MIMNSRQTVNHEAGKHNIMVYKSVLIMLGGLGQQIGMIFPNYSL